VLLWLIFTSKRETSGNRSNYWWKLF